MKTNYDKVKKYKELSKIIVKQYKHVPFLIWDSLSETRTRTLKDVCVKQGLKF